MRRYRVLAGAFFAAVAASCGGAPSARVAGPSAHADGGLVPARVRRLSNVEYERTVHALVGGDDRIAERLPPDVRQEGYTIHSEQAVPAAWGARVDRVAREIARRAVEQRIGEIAPCAASGSAHCRESVVADLGRRAFRRPLEPDETARLLRVLDEGAGDRGGARDGVERLLVVLLESPSLLYTTELGGGGAPGTVVTLTPYENASALSYMLRGGPPDEPLLSAAASGRLRTGEGREIEARRLLSSSDTRDHFRRFVLEWLEVEDLELTAKNEQLFPAYDELKSHMLAETTAFTDEVMVYGGGSARNLLDAGFASVDPSMARFYGLQTWGARASLRSVKRGGLLQQASFLSAHAHEDATSPVKRGDFVMRKLLCQPVPRPSELGIEIKIPPASSGRSARERFSAHVSEGICKSCHETLDALGYTFESFDASGASRDKDNGTPVNTKAKVRVLGAERTFADSLELTRWLAQSPAVSECFARQAFRYFSAGGGRAAEDTFVALRRELPESQRDNLFESLIAYVKSDRFIEREVPKP